MFCQENRLKEMTAPDVRGDQWRTELPEEKSRAAMSAFRQFKLRKSFRIALAVTPPPSAAALGKPIVRHRLLNLYRPAGSKPLLPYKNILTKD
jgi:hypothetical protein